MGSQSSIDCQKMTSVSTTKNGSFMFRTSHSIQAEWVARLKNFSTSHWFCLSWLIILAWMGYGIGPFKKHFTKEFGKPVRSDSKTRSVPWPRALFLHVTSTYTE